MLDILKRCYVLYLAAGALAFVLVSHQRVVFKTLDYLGSVPQTLTDFARHQDDDWPPYKAYDALRYYKNFVRLAPQLAPAKAAVGFCYYHMGEYGKAAKWFEQALVQEPQLFGLRYNLGKIYYRQGKYKEAIAMLTEAVNIPPLNTVRYSAVIYPDTIHPDPDQKVYQREALEAAQKAYLEAYKLMALSQLALREVSVSNEELYKEGKPLEKLGTSDHLFFYIPFLSPAEVENIKRQTK